jgi:hypothetical protein
MSMYEIIFKYYNNYASNSFYKILFWYFIVNPFSFIVTYRINNMYINLHSIIANKIFLLRMKKSTVLLDYFSAKFKGKYYLKFCIWIYLEIFCKIIFLVILWK